MKNLLVGDALLSDRGKSVAFLLLVAHYSRLVVRVRQQPVAYLLNLKILLCSLRCAWSFV
jgi:hypothetical protein